MKPPHVGLKFAHLHPPWQALNGEWGCVWEWGEEERNERRDHAFVPPSLIWLLARSLLLNLTSPPKSSKVVFLIKIVFSGRGY